MSGQERGVVVKEELMAAETLRAVIDFSMSVKDLLWDAARKQPRDLWAYIYDDPVAGALLYPPLRLTSVDGDAEGLILGGVGIVADMGSGGIGPSIVDREYVSGADKLSNGDFDLDALYWVLAAEGSLWRLLGGWATNGGGLHVDDVLEYDRKFPTRPGHAHRTTATGVTGHGRLRVRTIYEGRFNPANVLGDPLFAGAGWSLTTGVVTVVAGQGSDGGAALTIGTVPKPQSILNPGFETAGPTNWELPDEMVRDTSAPISGVASLACLSNPEPELVENHDFEDGDTGWSGGTNFEIVNDPVNARTGSGVLRCDAIPYPQYVLAPGLEDGGAAWTPIEPNAGDVVVVNDPANANDGDYVIRAGPVTRHQLFANSDMEFVHYVGPRPAGEARAAQRPYRGLIAPEGADEVETYLRHYGYLPPATAASMLAETGDISGALADYQSFFGLPVTGEADEATREMMARPRCGVADRQGPGESYVYIGTRWVGVSVLKWYLTDPSPFSQSDAAGAIVDAFAEWEPHVPFTFEETSVQAEAHIVFFRAAIDGVYNVLAYAWQPPGVGEPLLGTNNGDVTFDSGENWYITTDPGGYSDYLAVALHEIGHAIGLNHSAVSSAVMWPTSVNGRRTLDADDIAGIEYVYADIVDPEADPPDSPTPPAPGVIPYWFQSNDVDTPSEDYFLDAGGGMDGSQAIKTVGDTLEAGPGVPEHKYVRADANADPTGVDWFAVKPGEKYSYKVWVLSGESTNGAAYTSIKLRHPTLDDDDQGWHFSKNLDGVQLSTNMPNVWQLLQIDFDVPLNRYELAALLELHGHHFGHWKWDNATCTRVQGNRAQINGPTHRVIPGTKYLLLGLVRADDDMQVGSIRYGVILTGPGVEPKTEYVGQGDTDRVWALASLNFTPDPGYIYAQLFVAALDIVGAPVWFDSPRLLKVDNNIDQKNGTPAPVVPGQKYSLSADIRSAVQVYRGTVRVGVKLTGPGKAPLDYGFNQGITTPTILSPDEFDSWLASQPNGTPYEEFETASLADPNRGADGYIQAYDGTWVPDDTTLIPVPVDDNAAIGWAHGHLDVTPPDGFTEATVYVRTTDISIGDAETGSFWVDNVSFRKADNNTATAVGTERPVIPDQRYLLAASALSDTTSTAGTVTVGVTLTGTDLPPIAKSITFALTDGAIKGDVVEVTPPPDYTGIVPFVTSKDVKGVFRIDDITFTRMDNNTVSSVGTTIPVTPERTYRWTESVRSDVNLQRGTVTLSVRCLRAGYEAKVFDSSAMASTGGARKELPFEFTPPSGYDEVEPIITGTDVEGVWYVGGGDLRATDTSTMVFDTVSDNPVAAAPYVDSVAPDGAETVRVAVIAEQGTSGWRLDAVSLARTGVTPATCASIVADLLVHPQTGNPLAIGPGTITAPAVIPYDVVIAHRTLRDTLDYLCTVLADPPLEYHVLATDPPTIDVGPASVLFTVHDPADALLRSDFDVEALSNPSTDVADRPTEVTVLGAELATVSGRPFLVTATAQVPGPRHYDLNGNLVVRTKYVSDGTVDHVGYAQALADTLAAQEARPPIVLTAKLSGKDTRADSPPGDTIYAYDPDASLDDPAVSTTIEGQPARPRALRVQTRERAHGPSHRIVMVRPDGSWFPLTGVRWSEEDAIVLTIGDRLAPWDADPQGKSAGDEYFRDRAAVGSR